MTTKRHDTVQNAAVKFDKYKERVELLPKPALLAVARVLNHGAAKYQDWNWSKGFDWLRLVGAAERHLFAFEAGEDLDPESNLPHLAHATCCLLFLLQHYLSDLGVDDRHGFAGTKKHLRNDAGRIKEICLGAEKCASCSCQPKTKEGEK